MASVISRIQSNGINYALAHSAFGVCDTPGNEMIKNVTLCTGDDTTNKNFKLIEGVTVTVKFNHTNTGVGGPMCLNVNGTGNINIRYNSSETFNYFQSHHSYDFVYHDNYWELIGNNGFVSKEFIIYYDSKSNSIDRSIAEIEMFVANQYATRDKSLDTDTDATNAMLTTLASFRKLSVITEFNEAVITMPCIGIIDGYLFFETFVGVMSVALLVHLNPNEEPMFFAEQFQPLLDGNNKLDADYINLPYSMSESFNSNGQLTITFA